MTKNRRGFSLIELMVGVAILGILAAMGATSYMKAATKGKQSEAKAALAAAYSAEKNYFLEFNEYTTRFDVIGYKPDGSLYYNVGFNALDQAPSATAQRMGSITGSAACRNTCTAAGALTNNDCNYVCGTVAACPAGCVVAGGTCRRPISWTCTDSARAFVYPNAAPCAGPVATAVQFRILAAGRPNRLSDDQWCINELRQLRNARTGF